MIRYGKTTQTAIAAMSRLAEVYADGVQLSSGDIAAARDLPQTLVAKLLTMLSQAGLVTGSRGPGGGYALARAPKEISLLDIANVFERQDDNVVCPFGPNWCGSNSPCPLHNDYVAIADRFRKWQEQTTLAVFSKGIKKSNAK
ncbi:RrF2 family transcriptional regulator [Aeoliella sp. SH292]|uniref:RrF2 family transcriptional regulator n=1 Tax=Aeoliella sp. SH292 TaxID=3454464 RepID=UPI003F9A1E7E